MSNGAGLSHLPARDASTEPLRAFEKRLAAADRIAQKERGGVAFLNAWPWFAGLVLGGFGADVVLHFGGGVRAAMMGAFVLFLAAVACAAAWTAFRKRNSLEDIARILECRHPRLGSKLINLLQLREQAADPSLGPLTRRMAARAVAEYAECLRDEPVEQLARTGAVREQARRAGLGVLGLVFVLGVSYPITRVEIPRFLDPFGDHPPYSFTELEIANPSLDGAKVVYGQALLVTAKYAGHRPSELYLSYFPPGHPEKTVTASMFDKSDMGEKGFVQRILNIRSDLILFAHTKNRHAISRQRRIAVVLTPRLESAFVTITPPEYTGLPSNERPYEFKNLKALEGSRITFRLRSNRPLSAGHLGVAESDGPAKNITLAPGTGNEENEVSGSFEARQPAALKFSLVDRDGSASEGSWEGTLTVTHDLPPDVQIVNPSTDSFVAMDFKTEPTVEASDDFGLKTIRIHIAHNGVFSEPRVIEYAKPPLHAREALHFKAQELGYAPGDTLSIFAEAIDNAPTPHLTRSKTVTLTLISVEDYNDFLRERTDIADIEAKYSNLIADFRDLVERQKEIGKEIDALKNELDAAKPGAESAEVQKKLDALLKQQGDLNAKLNALADTMENFVRDKPVYDIESELKDTLAEKAKEIRDSTQRNSEDLQNLAPSQQAPSPKTLEDFKKASDAQLARLGETEEKAEEQVVQPLEDMSLMQEIVNDLDRYKDLYQQQRELAAQAKAYQREGPLNRADQLALKELAATQKQIGDDLDAVEQKLWEDGKAAEGKFPKAAASAEEIARQMGDLRLQTDADAASREMLAGNGSAGASRAETLRGNMEKLFTKCQAQTGSMSSELDQYLSLERSMKPGRTFGQMMQSKKFGHSFGRGSAMKGASGASSGQAVMTDASANVLGGEPKVSDDAHAQGQGNRKSQIPPNPGNAAPALDTSDVVRGVNPVNRDSEAVQGEGAIDEYGDVIENYFKALTNERSKAVKKP